MSHRKNKVFEIRGVNHVALVCKDMARTVDFYSNVLGMPLVKTIDLPNGLGQHFFFDIGNGDCLAFFWFPDAPKATPGVASAANLISEGPITSCHGSMNHIALNVPAERFDEYCETLRARGIRTTQAFSHDESETQMSLGMPTPTAFIRSIYFFDPDGICLEFACWTRPLDTRRDVSHDPMDQHGHRQPLERLLKS